MSMQDGPRGPVGVMGRMVLLDPQEQGTGSAVPAGQPAPATPAPAPAAQPAPATPAQAAPAQRPAPSRQQYEPDDAPLRDVTMSTPVDYQDENGNMVSTTLGELVQRHAATRNVDPKQVETISRALNNDPEANRRLLEQQLQRLQQANPQPDTPEAKRIAELENRLQGMETKLQSATRVSDAYETQEIAASVRHLLTTNEEVQKQLPWLAAAAKNPNDPCIADATRQIKGLRDASRVSGQGGRVSADVISRVLGQMNSRIETYAGMFGGSLSPNASGGQVVTATQTQQQSGRSMLPAVPGQHGAVRPPALTPQDILALASQPRQMPYNPANPPPLNPQHSGVLPPQNQVPSVVPQAGGQVGGAPPTSMANQPGNQPGVKFDRNQMVAALAARRAQEEAQQQ